MQAWIAKHGFADDKAFLDYAFALATHYGEAIGELSCQMYEATAAAQGVIVPAAEAAATPRYGEVAKVVHGAKKQSKKLVPSAIGRLVKQVGADTTLKNAERDGAQFAWVPMGDTCGFCLMLASRGWQYMSKKSLKNGHAEHIHANCDCQYSVRFDRKSTVQGYDPDQYSKMLEDAYAWEYGEGEKPYGYRWEDAVRSFRKKQTYESNAVHMKTGEMSSAEYTLAKDLWKRYTEIEISRAEKEYVYEELDNNLTVEERGLAVVRRAIGNYYYTAIHKGHNQYKITKKEPIERGTDSALDAILDEVLDFEWRSYE
ncbi:MAG: hypothetical protein Q4B15_08705 [Lachnospiraceae bacterium]|nr:hypothetical protein [Lachnospiraceae bacterium]